MRDAAVVRTMLDVDDDVLQAVKELAAVRRLTAGRVISELARAALQPSFAPGSNQKRRTGPPVPATRCSPTNDEADQRAAGR